MAARPDPGPDDLRALRRHRERLALGAFGVTALSMAAICAGIIASGWFAGSIQDRYERFFWAGAVCALLSVLVLAAASFPDGADDRRAIRRITALVRIGIVLFIAAPILCLGALIADFFW